MKAIIIGFAVVLSPLLVLFVASIIIAAAGAIIGAWFMPKETYEVWDDMTFKLEDQL